MATGGVGVFGGTFDPIHVGHLAAAQEAASQLGLDRVLFVPNRLPPHKLEREIATAEDRVHMVERAIAGNQAFELSTVELDRDRPSYTLDTMRQLRARFGDETHLCFLTGSDTLPALSGWHEPHALLDEFALVVLERPGQPPIDWQSLEDQFPGIRQRLRVISIPRLEISSDGIRKRIADGRPIRYYVPAGVEEFIRLHGLYSAGNRVAT